MKAAHQGIYFGYFDKEKVEYSFSKKSISQGKNPLTRIFLENENLA